MKRIVIETNIISAPYCGLKEVMIQLGNGLAARAPELKRDHGIELAFVVPPAYRGCFGPDVEYIAMTGVSRHLLKHFGCGRVDLFHAPHQYCTLKHLAGARHTLMTIHDINFMYEKKGARLLRGIHRLQWRLDHADHLSFISQFAQADTASHFTLNAPQRIIYNGVTDLTPLADSAPDGILPQLPDRFFFHVSSLYPKKNVHLLVDMMKYLPEEHLVIAGTWQNDDYGRSLQEAIANAPHRNITTLDRITEEQKAVLYSRCRAFMFPSLCEGFGLPPIEAMKFGKPVFLSTLTSLPEVGGDDAFFWPDLTPEAMAEVVRARMADAETDPSLSERLRAHAARFTWDKCIDGYIAYYLDILNS